MCARCPRCHVPQFVRGVRVIPARQKMEVGGWGRGEVSGHSSSWAPTKEKRHRGDIRDGKQYGVLSFNSTNWPTHCISGAIYETDGSGLAYFIGKATPLLVPPSICWLFFFSFRQECNRGAERDLFFPSGSKMSLLPHRPSSTPPPLHPQLTSPIFFLSECGADRGAFILFKVVTGILYQRVAQDGKAL